MSELATLREVELELENRELKYKIEELTCKLGLFESRRFTVSEPERIEIHLDPPPTLHAIARLQSKILPGSSLHIIGETRGQSPKFFAEYYVERELLGFCKLGYLAELHRQFIISLVKARSGK